VDGLDQQQHERHEPQGRDFVRLVEDGLKPFSAGAVKRGLRESVEVPEIRVVLTAEKLLGPVDEVRRVVEPDHRSKFGEVLVKVSVRVVDVAPLVTGRHVFAPWRGLPRAVDQVAESQPVTPRERRPTVVQKLVSQRLSAEQLDERLGVRPELMQLLGVGRVRRAAKLRQTSKEREISPFRREAGSDGQVRFDRPMRLKMHHALGHELDADALADGL